MSDNTHAAMCVYCGEAIIYDTREVTDMADAHAKIVAHDQACQKNPLVAHVKQLEEELDASRAFGNCKIKAAISECRANSAGSQELHPDNAAVNKFADAMKAKLAAAREKGRDGWDDPDRCSIEFLVDLLADHLHKDNELSYVDIANLAMMLHLRGAAPMLLSASLARRDAINQTEGMKKAALLIEKKADIYDAENGSTDPSTGHREYPGDGAEYYNELMELADELRQQAEGHQ